MNAPLRDRLLELNYQLTIQQIGQHCAILAEIGEIEEELASKCGMSVEAIDNAIAAQLPGYAREKIRQQNINGCVRPQKPPDPPDPPEEPTI